MFACLHTYVIISTKENVFMLLKYTLQREGFMVMIIIAQGIYGIYGMVWYGMVYDMVYMRKVLFMM